MAGSRSIMAGLCVWFVIHGNQVVDDGWEYEAPPLPTILSGVASGC